MCVCVYIYIYIYIYIYCAFVGLDDRPTSKFVHVIRLALAIARTPITIAKYDRALDAWSDDGLNRGGK